MPYSSTVRNGRRLTMQAFLQNKDMKCHDSWWPAVSAKAWLRSRCHFVAANPVPIDLRIWSGATFLPKS